MDLYRVTDTEVSAVATLMGCKPSSGLVNRMNDLQRTGQLAGCQTIGSLHRAVLLDMLRDALRG